MALRRRKGWLHDSLVLAAGVIAAALVLALLALLIGPVNRGGPALDLVLAAQVVPVAVVVLGFWLAFRQEAVDRKYHRFDD
jgi:uncharacterized membrane protein